MNTTQSDPSVQSVSDQEDLSGNRYARSYALPSDSDLVPEDYQNRLIHWRDVFKLGYFDIGDIALELCEAAARSGFRVSEAQVYAAVGKFCGKSGRTIRYYADHAAFFPCAVREKYDMLPFSHFVFARQMAGRWAEVLEYAAGHPAISEAALSMRFMGVSVAYSSITVDEDDTSKTSSPQVDETSPHYGPPVTGLQIDELSPHSRGAQKFSQLRQLSQLVEGVEVALAELPLSLPTRRRLSNALEDIRRAMPEITSKMG